MDENIVKFDDFNVEVDLREIDNMSKEDILKCKELIKEIENKIEE